MASVDLRVITFIKSIKSVLRHITNTLSKFDDSPARLQTESDKLTAVLVDIKRRMDAFVDSKSIGAEKTVLRNMLIFKVRDFLQYDFIYDDIRKTSLFDVVAREFENIFGCALHLREETEIIYDNGIPSGPKYDRNIQPDDPSGNGSWARENPDKRSPGPMGGNFNLHYQYSILDNLHRRLTALEQRMSVN